MDKLGLGREMEALVADHWTNDGFKCWMPPRMNRRNADAPVNRYMTQDVFELFDFIAVKPWCPVNLVQVKRHRVKEAAKAFDAIKAWADASSSPVMPFVVLWRKDRHTERIRFQSYYYGLGGWGFAGEWTDE